MRTIRLFLAVMLPAVSALAQAPGWSRGQQLLSINYDECVRRAPLALQAEGYRVDYAAGAFAVGQKNVHTAVITCNAAPEAKMWVNVIVASNGEGGASAREQLQAQMDRATPAAKGDPVAPGRAGRYLTVRMNGRMALLDWTNAPTNAGAWVSIVPAGAADGTHVGRWTYTEQKATGRYETGPLDNGSYEARFYGDGGYGAILDRVRFEVTDPKLPGGGVLSVQLSGRSATVAWNNAPTTAGAWVSVVPVGTSDGTHTGKWAYTNSTASGSYAAGALGPGEYEARFYGDGGYGRLLERTRFRVD